MCHWRGRELPGLPLAWCNSHPHGKNNPDLPPTGGKGGNTSSLPMETIRLENASSNYSPEFPPPASHVPSERGPRLVLLSTVTSSSGPFTKVQAEPNPFFFFWMENNFLGVKVSPCSAPGNTRSTPAVHLDLFLPNLTFLYFKTKTSSPTMTTFIYSPLSQRTWQWHSNADCARRHSKMGRISGFEISLWRMLCDSPESHRTSLNLNCLVANTEITILTPWMHCEEGLGGVVK